MYGDDNSLQLQISIGYDGKPVVQQVTADLKEVQAQATATTAAASNAVSIADSAARLSGLESQVSSLARRAIDYMMEQMRVFARDVFTNGMGQLASAADSSRAMVVMSATNVSSALRQFGSDITASANTAASQIRNASNNLRALPYYGLTPNQGGVGAVGGGGAFNAQQWQQVWAAFTQYSNMRLNNAAQPALGGGGGYQNVYGRNVGGGGGVPVGPGMYYYPPGGGAGLPPIGGFGAAGGAGGFGGPPPIPPATTNSWMNFNAAAGLVQDSMNTLLSLSLSLARTGFGLLVTEMGAVLAATEKLVKQFVAVNERFAGLEITLESSFKSPELAKTIRDQIANITATSPVPFQGLSELTRALAVLPQTRGRLLEAAEGGFQQNNFLQQAVTLTEKMLAFRPEKTVTDVVFALREALGGEFRSLVRRFDIPLSLVSSYSGKTSQELKMDQSATFDAIKTLFDKIIDDSAIRRYQQQPTALGRNIWEQLFEIPSLRIGDAGIYSKITGELVSFYNSLRQVTERTKTSGGAEIEGSSLIEKYAPQLSDGMSRIFDSLIDAGNKALETLLSRVGFGSDRLPNVTVIERTIQALVSGINLAADKLPGILDKGFQFLQTVIPMLTKIGEITITLAETWSRAFSAAPITTLAATALAPSLVRSGANSLFNATGNAIAGGLGGFTNAAGSTLNPGLGAAFSASPLGTIVASVGTFIISYAAAVSIRDALNSSGYLPRVLQSQDEQTTHDVARQNQEAAAQRRAYQSPEAASGLQGALQQYLDFQDSFKGVTGFLAKNVGLSAAQSAARENDLRTNLEKFGLQEADIFTHLDDLRFLLQRVNNILAGGKFTGDPTRLNNLNEYFSKLPGQGGPVRDMNDVVSMAMKDSLGHANVAATGFDLVRTSASYQDVTKTMEELSVKVNPIAKDVTRLDSLLSDQAKLAKSIADVFAHTGDTNVLAAGNQAAIAVLQQVITTIDQSGLPSDKYLPVMNTTVGKLRDEYQGMLDNVVAGIGDVAQVFKDKAMEFKDRAYATQVDNAIAKAGEAIKLLNDSFTGVQNKQVFAGPNSQALIADLRTAFQKMDSGLYGQIKSQLDVFAANFPIAGDDPANQKKSLQAAAEAKANMTHSILNWLDSYINTIQKQISEIYGSFAPISTGTFYSTGSPPVAKGGGKFSDISGGRAPTNPIIPDGGLFGTTGGPLDYNGPDNSGGSIFQAVELPQLTQSLDNAKKLGKTMRGIEQHERDAAAEAGRLGDKPANKDWENQLNNAVQSVTGFFSGLKNLQDGPLKDFQAGELTKSLGKFPQLGEGIDTNFSALFKSVRAGAQGIDDVYDNMKAGSDLAAKFAANLDVLASKETNVAEKDKLTDQATKLRQVGAEMKQVMYDLDKYNNPISSFWDGFIEKAGIAKHAVGDLRDQGRQAADALQNDLGNAFADFVTGTKTAKQAFSDFAVNIVKDLAKIAAEAATKQLLGLLTNLATSAGSYFAGGGSNISATGSAGQYYADGGRVIGGSGMYDDVPAMLTGGEYVVHRDAARRYGPLLDAINNDTIRHFASGGYVDHPSPSMPRHASSVAGRGPSSGDTSFNFTINRGSERSGVDGNSPEERRRRQEQDEEMARRLHTFVLQVLDDQKRQGGRLTR